LTQPFTHADFVRIALGAFPDLAEEFSDIREYPTLQVAALGERMQRAKGNADWDSYERGVRIVDELRQSADEQLYKALSFSLMRALDFEGPRGTLAWDLLTPDLKRAWQSARKELDERTALPRKSRNRRR
jgi:hypothetical protein